MHGDDRCLYALMYLNCYLYTRALSDDAHSCAEDEQLMTQNNCSRVSRHSHLLRSQHAAIWHAHFSCRFLKPRCDVQRRSVEQLLSKQAEVRHHTVLSWAGVLLLFITRMSLQGCNLHNAFKSQRRPVRAQAQRSVRAEQGAEDRQQAVRSTMKHLTAFLAAGAVLLPHAAIAVSGGGGMLIQLLCTCCSKGA